MSYATRMSVVALCLLMLFSVTGCQSNTSIDTSKLADYSNLYAQNPTALVYMQSEVSNYNAFLVENAHYRMDTKTKIRPAKLKQIASQLDQTIKADMTKAGYSLVYKPQPGVVRIRIVLAQINDLSSVYAQTEDHVTKGLAPGQAVVEAEILSLDGKQQLGALVIADEKHPVSIQDLQDEAAAKEIFAEWAKQLRLRIDQMHGRSTM
ncbi:MAG TPA: hypothetical protein DCM28_18840 [Phycisphaerales bacterium]|nr:hypothetical protein [Phycisphaerales bacterium]